VIYSFGSNQDDILVSTLMSISEHTIAIDDNIEHVQASPGRSPVRLGICILALVTLATHCGRVT
jgi:hypothetical protein